MHYISTFKEREKQRIFWRTGAANTYRPSQIRVEGKFFMVCLETNKEAVRSGKHWRRYSSDQGGDRDTALAK